MIIDEILEFNKEFVKKKEYEQYATSKYPSKKVLILSCMDTRLTGLLPAALGLKNGDVKMIKNAGAIVAHPFGSVMRSIIVAVYNLGVTEILVIAHSDCGVQSLKSEELIEKMKQKNIPAKRIEFLKYCGVDFDKWLEGFEDAPRSVIKTVENIKSHPLLPDEIIVCGLIIDPATGKLDLISKLKAPL